MSNYLDSLKKNWDVAAAVFGFASSSLLTFRSLVDMPLDARLIFIGVFGVIMVAFVVVAVTRAPARGMGFASQPIKARPSRLAIAGKIVLILLICAVAVFLLQLTVTYHNICFSQTTDSRDVTVGTIEVQPSHFPADLTLILSTPQPDVRILDLHPQGCGDDPINTPNMQDPNDFSAIIHLYRFKTSQKFCLSYHLSDRADRLNIAVTTTVSNIEVLRDDRVRLYRKRVCSFGGALCLIALVFFSYRCYWFRKQRN